MIKAVIFDLNGVFLESEPLSERFSTRFGVSQDIFLEALKEIMQVERKPGAPPAYSLWKTYFDKWDLVLTESEFFDFWFSGEKLVPEMVAYAKELKDQGLKVFVLSNNFKERTTYYRQNLGEIFSGLDGEYFSWETGYVKPDPEAYRNILSKNELNPEECVYFDDSDANVESAKSLGIQAFKYDSIAATKKVMLEIVGRQSGNKYASGR